MDSIQWWCHQKIFHMEPTGGLLLGYQIAANPTNISTSAERLAAFAAWDRSLWRATPFDEGQGARSAAGRDGVRWKLHQLADGDARKDQRTEKIKCQGRRSRQRRCRHGSGHQFEGRCQNDQRRKYAKLSDF